MGSGVSGYPEGMVVLVVVPFLLMLAVLGMERLEARVLPGHTAPTDDDLRR
jgi:hypothetical protein